MEKEIEELKKEINNLKDELYELRKELNNRPTREQMEKYIHDYIHANVPLR